MTIAEAAVRDFGLAMGMRQLAFNQHGVVRLKFDKTGALSIERAGDGAMVRLARPIDRFKDGILERALELCHFDKSHKLRPEAGLAQDGSLVFSVHLQERSLDRSTLDGAFDFLRRLHDQTAGQRS